MHRKTMLFSLIMVFFYTTAAFGATSIDFTFANEQVTGADQTYYEFDVMAAAGAAGTRIGDCMAYINYNAEYFGSQVKGNSKITVSAGTLTQGFLYSLMVNDNTASRVAITAEYIKSDLPELANELPSTPTQWVHVILEIVDPSKTAEMSFRQSLMSGNEYESDNSTKYWPVLAEGVRENPWDVNGDGQVDISDLVLVGRYFGEIIQEPIWPNPDINGDGVVDVSDLVLVGLHFGESAVVAAPFVVDMRELNSPRNREKIQQVLAALDAIPNPSRGAKLARQLLQTWLADEQPLRSDASITETKLLPNYPNPFNSETWIPYQLAFDTEVKITIYDARGVLVRRLELGYQRAGYYHNRLKAAYWDGKSEMREPVSSGLYFYQLRAGNFTTVNRMVLLK